MVRVTALLICFTMLISAFTFSFQTENTAGGIDSNAPEPLAAVTFTNVSEEVGLAGVAGDFLAWGDYNNDGYQDLLVNGRRLFRNTGPPSWKFTEVTSTAGITGGNYGTWGDYDNDGYLDFYAPGTDRLWHNNGDGTFTDVTTAAGGIRDTYNSAACGWGDYDSDGYIDLYIANYEDANMNGYPDALWHNEGNGTFTNVTESAGVSESEPSRGVSWGDYDDDGDLDIYISNYRIRPNHLWENQGNGTFRNVAVDKGVEGHETVRLGTSYYGHTVGSAWADYDNDGDLDMWSTNLVHKDLWRGPICDDSYMFRNNGPAEGYNFTDVRQFTDIPTKNIGGGEDELMVGVAWGDYDNDGYLDLFLPQVYNDIEYAYSYLYHNDGDGTFTEVSTETGVRVWDTYGGAWCDYNNDGWLDLVTEGKGNSSVNGTHEIHLYRNNGNTNNWLQVTLKGTVSNAAAIGARVSATGGGVSQLREVEGGMGSHSMQNSLMPEFGWGTYSGTVDISVRWPTGLYQNQTGVGLNQHITITEKPVYADLIVENLSVSKQYPVAGDIVQLVATIKNIGDAAATNGTVTFFEDPVSKQGPSIIGTDELLCMVPPGKTCKAFTKWNTTNKVSSDIIIVISDVLPGDSNSSNDKSTYPITVRSSNELPKAVLEVKPVLAGIDDTVTFNGSGSTDDIVVVRYRFYFGDGLDSGWLTTPVTTHKYTSAGEYEAYLIVEDYDGAHSDMNSSSARQMITISAEPVNHAPVINKIDLTPREVAPGGSVKISVDASDEDGDEINYFYSPEAGTMTGSGPVVYWTAPLTEGDYKIQIHISDGKIESERMEIEISVKSSTTENQIPVILGLSVNPTTIAPDATATVSVNAYDPEGNDLLYRYSTTGGTITGDGSVATYFAPAGEGDYQISVVVNDGELDSLVSTITVTVFRNDLPVISSIIIDPEEPVANEVVKLQVFASDPDGDKLSYDWVAEKGSISGTGSKIFWTAPDEVGFYEITVTVFDTHGGEVVESISINVIYPAGGPDIIRINIQPDSAGNDGTEEILITVEIGHPASLDFIEEVLIDLTGLGGTETERLYDNGRKGDDEAGDGIYSIVYTVPYGTPEGLVELTVTAEDINGNIAADNGVFVVKDTLGDGGEPEPVLSNMQFGILVGCVVVIILIILLVLYYYQRTGSRE